MVTRSLGVRSAAVLCATIAALVPTSPTHAADGQPVRHLTRLCDPTGCLVAWGVADSDGDGVSDADELMAGTDPHDPASRPSLTLAVDLAADRKLPSLENGLAALVVFPEEIIKAREKLAIDPLGAFQMNTRKDTLTRLGISSDLLSAHGISIEQGFSLGLDHPSKDGGLPGRKVAGIDASLISADGGVPNPHATGGGVKQTYTTLWGTRVTIYNDGSEKTVTPISGGVEITTKGADGKKGPTVVDTGGSTTSGPVTTANRTIETYSPDGAKLSTVTIETTSVRGGASTTTTTVKEYVNDAKGKVIGVTITKRVETTNKDGSSSVKETRKSCDAKEENCTPEQTAPAEEGSKYIDPDYAYANMVASDVEFDQVMRLHGASVTVVEGWTAPGLENEPSNPRNPSTVALVDSETGLFYLLVEPMRITTAQPEGRPDLPNPRDGVPPKSGGGCNNLC